MDYWDYSEWYARLLAAKASHKWEPSSNGRAGSVPFYECSHQWPLSHLSSLFIRMQMRHLKQKSWMDFLEGSMSPKEEVGCLSRTGMWWDTTLHHLWATNGGREKVACRKKGKKTSKGICADPQKSARSMKIIRSLLVVGQLYFHTNTFCFIFHF